MVPQLTRIVIWSIGLHTVWEGLAARQWTDGQLAALQADLASADFLRDLQLALRGEKASINMMVAQMEAHPGWMKGDDGSAGAEKIRAQRNIPQDAVALRSLLRRISVKHR